jgi:hypothetical protein
MSASPKRLKIVTSKTTPVRWVRLKYVKIFIDKPVAKNKKQLNLELVQLFPAFQQFKVEIRNIPQWCMDWEQLGL